MNEARCAANASKSMARQRLQRHAVDRNLAAMNLERSTERPQQRGFARTAGPDECYRFAATHVEFVDTNCNAVAVCDLDAAQAVGGTC
jgi:hypothetical protein